MRIFLGPGRKCQLNNYVTLLSRYYAVCVLNQFVITQSDQELATRLVEIYFTFFKVITLSNDPVSLCGC